MAKTIDLASDSTSILKKGDTTFTMKWVCGNDNLPVDLSDATAIEAKFIKADSQGTLYDLVSAVEVTPSDQTDLVDGIVSIKFTEDVMSKLDPGWYACEIHATTPDGVAIYPTESYVVFQIMPSY